MITAVRLKTEYLNDPMGIDVAEPFISWNAEGALRQSAFQLRASVDEGDWILFDAEKSASMHASLPLPLESRSRVRWQVRLWDENQEPGSWSSPASFEMGLLHASDWKARWIMGAYRHSKKPEVRSPVDHFRRSFHLDGKAVRARLYITACGMYEARFNGKKAGSQVLTPGSTAFHKRVHYQTCDVTSLLETENVWTIELADGYYAGKTGVFGNAKTYGYEPKVLAQLEITYTDGRREIIGTDSRFDWSNDGPVRLADMKDGEVVDLRCKPTYLGKAEETSYGGIVCASNNVPVLEHERFASPRILQCPDGQTVLDFGQNLAGYMEVSVCGNPGHICSMTFGEKLDEKGNFTVANIAWKSEYNKCHFQTNDLICDGTRHIYKPKFTVMGFRYVLLRDWPEEIRAENFTAIAAYSDMDTTFRFTSSDTGINQIVHNTFWSVKGNFLDVPTDCPTRERAGWTGDAQLFFNTGNYMMDQRSFFRKWLRDVADCQKADGLVYNINPAAPGKPALVEWVSMEGSAGWGDAMITIPWYFWKRYGDDCLIREFWQPMEKCFAFFHSRLGKRNLLSLNKPEHSRYDKYIVACGRHFGEWAEPEDCAPPSADLLFPMTEEATAYFSYSARLMAEMAEHLGKNKAAEYADLAEKSKEAYNYYFVCEGEIQSSRMCKYVRPCALGLADGNARQKLLEKIVRLNRERGFRIGTGFLSTPFFFGLLTEAGESDDAWRTLKNPEIGWMQQIGQGATTVWENWTPDASLNHYSKGACCQWLFDTLCGIRLDGRENHFLIMPHLVSQLDHISFSYDSVYGTVSSGWRREEGGVTFSVTVPPNCTAAVRLPGEEEKELGPGTACFHLRQIG
ncbi:MAG: family 78 glycoside hydrolase catalytic domain [Lachnospiraceae bacterium]|nr:family 78 glycoside hydrolase catalytic domain [Lachnospiraceae bacterium]